MPPRKKTKLASRGESGTPQADNVQSGTRKSTLSEKDSGTAAAGGHKSESESDGIVDDPWTDEQETALLKGIVRWKPVGMHKHFRMIAIAEYMKSQGYAPANEEHTRIPGIWRKLGSLYNLPALDEREDSIIADGSDESEYCPFKLPDDEYGDMMFSRRLAAERSPSISTFGQPDSRRGSTVADTDEPRSSPAPSRGRRSNRSKGAVASTGATTTRGKRATRLQVEVENSSRKTQSSDRGTSVTGEGEGDEDEEMEDADNDEEEEASQEENETEEEDENADEEPTEAASPTTRTTRTQSNAQRRKKKDQVKPAAPRRGTRRR